MDPLWMIIMAMLFSGECCKMNAEQKDEFEKVMFWLNIGVVVIGLLMIVGLFVTL